MPRPYTPQDLEAGFGPATYQRGQAFARSARVHHLEVVQDAPRALVLVGELQGATARTYQIDLDWDGEAFSARCSCPTAANCKHAVALLLAFAGRRTAAGPPGPGDAWRALVAAAARQPAASAADAAPGEAAASLALRLRVEPLPAAPHDMLVAALHLGDAPVPPADFDRALLRADPGERALLNAVRTHLARGVRADGWSAIAPVAVDGLLTALAASNRVHDAHGHPLAIRPREPATLALAYAPTPDGGATLQPHMPGTTDLLVVGAPTAWVLAGGTLRPLAPASHALLDRRGPTPIPPADRPEFERHHLPDLLAAGRVVGPAQPAAPDIRPGTPAPQLLLDAHEGRLRGRLGFVYGREGAAATAAAPGIRVEADDPARHVAPPGGPLLRRDPAAEAAWTAHMPKQRPLLPWLPPAPQAAFTLADEAALDFLFDALPALVAAGFEVLGEEALGDMRVTRAPARSAFRVRSGEDWLDLAGGLTIDGEAVPWNARWSALARKQRWVRLGSGRHARLPADWLAANRPLLEALAADPEKLGAPGGIRVARHQAPAVAALLDAADDVQADRPWRAFAKRLRAFGGITPVPVPAGFAGALRPYQQQGLNYLSFLRDHGLHGILADDMGLGKTVQAAALLLANHQGHAGPPSLVIAPTSLVPNWQAELARFAPSLRTLVLHGPARDPAAIAAHDVVITTYATARLDLAALQTHAFHTLILDEAQAIKNPASQTARAMRALTARHRLCLTGTPVENHLTELWSQFAFLMPGLLGKEREFQARWAAPIAAGDRAVLAALKARIAPFILRRLKADVARDLPPRTDVVVWCELGPAQRRLYDATLAAGRATLLAGDAAPGGGQLMVLEALLRLRQACGHPALLGNADAAAIPSAKLEACLELVDELVAGGHRALVFSQFTAMLALVREALDAKGLRYEYLDGASRDRKARVDRFNQGDMPLFLISLKAGGTGLNLTGADYVIHLDPWWNPAVEDQATDRAHRIGQTRPVISYKLIARDTIEEKLLALQARKRALSADVLDVEALGKALTPDDMRFLFGDPADRPC